MINLLKQNDSKHIKATLWNAVGAGLMAGQASILLVFISHLYDQTIAGIVVIAHALSLIFFNICRYGVRTFQVTDVKEQYTFKTYAKARLITGLFAATAFIAYMIIVYSTKKYNTEKVLIISEIVFLKIIDAIEDLFIGRMQQKGRFDVGAKILAIRYIITTFVMLFLAALKIDIKLVIMAAIFISIMIDIVLLYKNQNLLFLYEHPVTNEKDAYKEILKYCFPLCVGTTAMVYLSNVPKYIIDGNVNEETQAVFGYLMIPMFVVTLLNQFIYIPLTKKMGDLWNEKKYGDFFKKIKQQCLIVIGLCIAVFLAFITIGLDILSFMYNADLKAYSLEFALLVVACGFYSIANYLVVPLTTIRLQKVIAAGSVPLCILAILTGQFFLRYFGLIGVIFQYVLINVILDIIFFYCIIKARKSNSPLL